MSDLLLNGSENKHRLLLGGGGGVTFVHKSYLESYDMCVDHPVLRNGKKLNQCHTAKNSLCLDTGPK